MIRLSSLSTILLIIFTSLLIQCGGQKNKEAAAPAATQAVASECSPISRGR